jgi:hypothetical protein
LSPLETMMLAAPAAAAAARIWSTFVLKRAAPP